MGIEPTSEGRLQFHFENAGCWMGGVFAILERLTWKTMEMRLDAHVRFEQMTFLSKTPLPGAGLLYDYHRVLVVPV